MARVETWGPVPLSADEIERACAIVQASPDVPDGVRFVWAAVAEGTKGAESDVRLAEVLCYHRPTGSSHRVDVDLDAGAVVAHDIRDDVQPSLIYEEYSIAGEVGGADPGGARRWRSAASPTSTCVQVDPWATGNFGLPWEEGRRVVRAMSPTARHAGRQRLRAPDRGRDRLRRPRTTPRSSRRGLRRGAGPGRLRPLRRRAEPADPRPTLKPLEITQPEGPSFTVDGNAMQLAEWRLPRRDAPARGPRAPRRRLRRRRRGARSSTAPRSPRWSSRTATPRPRTAARTPSTPASPASASSRTRSTLGLRLPGRDPLLRRGARRRATASRRRSRTRSACTRRTTASSGSTPTARRPRRGAPLPPPGRQLRSQRSGTTSTGSSGTSTRTARSSSR